MIFVCNHAIHQAKTFTIADKNPYQNLLNVFRYTHYSYILNYSFTYIKYDIRCNGIRYCVSFNWLIWKWQLQTKSYCCSENFFTEKPFIFYRMNEWMNELIFTYLFAEQFFLHFHQWTKIAHFTFKWYTWRQKIQADIN